MASSDILKRIDALNVPEEWKALMDSVAECGLKMDVDRVLRIWRLANHRAADGITANILWIEQGNDKSGLEHIMQRHGPQFASFDQDAVTEICEAATQIGLHMGFQGRGTGRPIFGLFFHGQPLAVAVTVASNGFVVSMNRRSYEAVKQKSKINRGIFDDVVKALSSWPLADPPVRRSTFLVNGSQRGTAVAARTRSGGF